MTAPTINPFTASASSPKQNGWYLIGRLPPSSVLTEVPVASPSLVIGRHSDCGLQVASRCVSGRHAEIVQIGAHLFIRDLGSTNGTYVNRRKVKQPLPLAPGDHIELANVEFRIENRREEKKGDQPSLDLLTKTIPSLDSFEPDWILSQFHELIQQRAVTPHYQPILDLRTGQPAGYEGLARTELPGLETPSLMFDTAKMVHRQIELSIICRERAVEEGGWIEWGASLFINTHPDESLATDVLPSLTSLRERYPERPLVLEIHESSIQDPRQMLEFTAHLKDLGVKTAYDDFGAGQSRLFELVKAPPDFLKFDACLIRDIHQGSPHQWKMLQMLVDMARDVSITTIAEGVEQVEEADACRQLGFELAQGYYFGRPAPPPLGART